MFVHPKDYDVIVVGGGHAGVEAALASARLGCVTLLLSGNLDTIAQMSCNPAIGGTAKGQLVREIDALGGQMGRTTDLTGIQFRMLNRGKGPSVWAPRAQCDKKAYQFRMKWFCETQPNLDVKQGQVIRLVHADGDVRGVEIDIGVQFNAKIVIVTTGTFLRGLLHYGLHNREGGRAGDPPSESLSASLQEIGIELRRLKTGTPPRLLRSTIDFSRTEEQPGEEPPPLFSHWNDELFHVEQSPEPVQQSCHTKPNSYPPGSILAQICHQLSCYLTSTTQATSQIVKSNLIRSPLYSGIIRGTGPRYCPSVEDKIMRFPDRESHQIFLEPEGAYTDEIYINGLSTSLPIDVQYQLVRSVVGCENAEITRPGYAVEYDSASPSQLKLSLESKCLRNLYLAGQINGTSGYEEAAAQGLVAGINAAQKLQGKDPIVFGREESYIGVLIDDLVSKAPTEPYRLFSSRAEFRLHLRQDNADLRLSALGYTIGLVQESNYRKVDEKRQAIHNELVRLDSTRLGHQTLKAILRKPEVTYRDLPSRDERLPRDVTDQVEILVKYEGYLERQGNEVAKLKALESKRIPSNIDYHSMLGLGSEARSELSRVRPETVGQASRIAGVTPADVALLLVRLKSPNA